MFLLVRAVIHTQEETTDESIAPAFIAGLLYMFLPFHVAHASGHFGAMQTQWLPLIFLTVIWNVRKPSIAKAVLLGLLILIQGWTEHHYLLWLSLVTLIALVWWWRVVRGKWAQISSKLRIGYVLVALITLLLLGASYLPTARLAVQADSYVNLGRDQLIRFSADLFSFVTPAPFHPIWGDFFYTLFADSFTGNVSESTLFIGIIPLLIILFFHQSIPKSQKKFWFVVGLVFFGISLGPKLHVFGHVTAIPLPYELFDELPIISAVRAVSRAAVVVNIAVAVLFGLVLRTQLHRKGSAIALGALLLLEFLFFPVSVQSTKLSDVYAALENIPQSTVIEIPAATNYTAASKALYASHIHGKDVLGSIALERAQSQEEFNLPKSVPAVRQLLYLRTTDLRERRVDFFNQSLSETLPDALRYLDVGAIVVHKDSLSALQFSALDTFLKQALNIEPTQYADVVLYTVDRNNEIITDGVFLMRDGAWQGVGFDPERNSIFAEVSTEATVTVVNTGEERKKVVLQFATAPESQGSGRVMVGDELITMISPNTNQYEISIDPLPGEHTISFIADSSEKIILQNPQLTVRQTSL